MTPLTLTTIEAAIRASFAPDTCSPDDLDDWTPQNASRGHCAVTALVLHDLFGGDLLCAEVHRDGERFGYHWWNRIAGLDVDLTRDQFDATEIVQAPIAFDAPEGDHLYRAQYELFRARVGERIGR